MWTKEWLFKLVFGLKCYLHWVHLYFLVSAWNKNRHKNIVNMHRLHDVWQFSETSLKHRIVKNWKTSFKTSHRYELENIASLRKSRHRPPLVPEGSQKGPKRPKTAFLGHKQIWWLQTDGTVWNKGGSSQGTSPVMHWNSFAGQGGPSRGTRGLPKGSKTAKNSLFRP